MTLKTNQRQVFYDPKGRRQQRVRLAWIIVGLTVTTLAAIFIIRVLTLPAMPQLNLKSVNISQPPGGVQQPLAIGFYVNWDNSSYYSLERNLAELDLVVPQWVRLQDGVEPVVYEMDQKAIDLIRRQKPNLPIIPMVQNSNEGKWDALALVHAVENEASRKRLIYALAKLIDDNKWQGICIDFEKAPKAAQPNLLRFMRELHTLFKQRGWLVLQAVPFDDPDWNYRAYAEANDYLMLMAYDEHSAGSAPGSVCGQPWFQKTLARRMSELAPDKTIICIGGYGYDWGEQSEATVKTFREAMLAAVGSEAKIHFDRTELNPYFKYEEDGSERQVWFLDAVTAYNQMVEARKYGVAGFALWRLGSEDPSLWSIFGANKMDASPEVLQQIRYGNDGNDVDILGKGEILEILARPKDGMRNIEIDTNSKFITTNQYQVCPSSYLIRRMGHKPGHVALTFDDGPDPDWTPRILDILKEEQVKATFFIIGQNAQADPDLAQRIVNEGHDIGNHSFTHPTLHEIHTRITKMELNATRLLIESLTGRNTMLFRPPYFGAEPTTPDKAEPAWIAKELGYITVGARVNPMDWALPGAEEIVERTIAGITNPDPNRQGQIVLLHDGGGDRSQTVEALPKLIHDLRSRDYRFSTISELAGLTRDQAMGLVQRDYGFYDFCARVVASTFYAFSLAGDLMRRLFLIGVVLGLSRMIFIGSLAFTQWLQARKRRPANSGLHPLVSVIVPAYNEEKVIAQTIECLLASTYPNFEIIVVDDGSSDLTSEVVSNNFNNEPHVRLFTTPNAGKAEALNYGLRQARGEVIIGLDADTFFEKETIDLLARRFADPAVGAVAGNVKVGNRVNLVTRWQALEYVISQNLDRRAFASLNCITIVPGAVGAWRRGPLEQAGGWVSDTLAEDQELTLKIRRLGYQIAYEEDAIAWTEAPQTVRDLAKQRFRWSFGTLQCMWKHRDALFRPKYGALGFIAMPNVWIFQILFSLISPVMDLTLIWAFASVVLARLGHPAWYLMEKPEEVISYFGLFLAADLFAASLAFAMERREQWSLVWPLFLQRFCHRQVIYYVMIKSALAALSGVLVGWRKLERKATVVARKSGPENEPSRHVPGVVEVQR
jgi:cellulose synthase/poly-beta-1,6-N-acetylglucosamine synthase-like glycosyltransferase/peptidoglycan/xylan/chitin deacetylase (PgdA/CDA1 family)/spore germination protein YaaH